MEEEIILHEMELALDSATVDEGEVEEESSVYEEEFVMVCATVDEKRNREANNCTRKGASDE